MGLKVKTMSLWGSTDVVGKLSGGHSEEREACGRLLVLFIGIPTSGRPRGASKAGPLIIP